MALQLRAWIAGDDIAKAIQLNMEYDLMPPFESGSLKQAGPVILDKLRSMSRPQLRKKDDDYSSHDL